MNLKNYTSTVPVSRTIARIEECLSQAGATGIMKSYADGKLQALCFKMGLPNGKEVAVRLPANEDAIYKTFIEAVRRPRNGTIPRLREQASRTAWKLQQDWIEVQLSLIQMGQAEAGQVFLAYIWDGHRTYFQALQEGKFKSLPEATE